MKMPAMQFYPADWRKDPAVQALGYFERGVWFEMLCLMHESSERGVLLLNGMPMPEEALSNALGLDNQTLNTCITKLVTYGVVKRRDDDGALFSKRMVADERLCQMRRECGKLGGNPNLVKQNKTSGVKQIKPPSIPSSSSDKTKRDARTSALDERFDRFWTEYPKKVGKEAARKAWLKMKPDIDAVLKALLWQKESEQWKKDGGQYVPNPSTYLNQGRWQDEPGAQPQGISKPGDESRPAVHKCGVEGCKRDASSSLSYGWRCPDHLGRMKP